MSISRQDILRLAIATEEEQKLFQHRDRDFQIWNQDFMRTPPASQQKQEMETREDACTEGDDDGSAWRRRQSLPGLELPMVMQQLNPEAEDFQPGFGAAGVTAADLDTDRHGLVSNPSGAFRLPLASGLTLLDVRRPGTLCPRCRQQAGRHPLRPAPLESESAASAIDRPCGTSQPEDRSGGSGKTKSARIPTTRSPRFFQSGRLAPPPADAPVTAPPATVVKPSNSPVAVVRPQPPSAMIDAAAASGGAYMMRPPPPYGYPAPMPATFPVPAAFPFVCIPVLGGHQHHPMTTVVLPSQCPAGILLAPAHHLPWLMPPQPQFPQSLSPPPQRFAMLQQQHCAKP